MADPQEDKPEDVEARMAAGLKRALHMPRKEHEPLGVRKRASRKVQSNAEHD